MRGLRSTIALFVVLIGLSAYIYFVTSKTPEGTPEAPKERVYAGLNSDVIDELTVKSEAGETTTLKKTAGIWQITAPRALKADTAELGTITSNLSSLEVSRVVDENPTDVKEYGLEMPLVEITFKASGDKTYGGEHRLLLGAKSPTGGDVFARRDADKRVVLVPGYLEPIFNRSMFNLRDKTLLLFDREKVDHISVSAGSSTLEFAKQGVDWNITRPIAAAADTAAVDAIIGRLMTSQMKSIVTEQAAPADLTKYGFGKPQATATLTGGGATTTLVIGGAATDPDVYARDGSKPLIATVEGTLLKDFQKSADEYRRKEIFASRSFSTDRLEFTRDGQTTALERVKTSGQPDKWQRSPNAGEPAASAVDDLITRLESLRAEAFVASLANTGLDKPTLTVYSKFDEGKKEERVSFAKTGTMVYAVVPGQPGAVTIAPSAFDEVVKALDAVSK